MNTQRMEQLRFLIAELQKEMPQFGRQPVPESEEEAFSLFRALCNVRPPAPASPEFLQVQDEVLQAVTTDKGIVDVEGLTPTAADARICIWQGDITRLKCDAIVNAANSQMLGCFSPLHGCIDNMIHTMTGVQLRLRCNELMQAQGHEEPTGQAKITPGYNLPARHVIHTVGPIADRPLSQKNREDLVSCYRSCLSLAAENGCTSLVFCCISTGVFGFPADEAASIAVTTVHDWLAGHGLPLRVVFDVWKDSDLALYRSLLEE